MKHLSYVVGIVTLIGLVFSPSESFAATAKTNTKAARAPAAANARSLAPAMSGSEATMMKSSFWGEDEETEAERIEREKEQQKTMEDINTFLIESYKIKLDKILENVYASVAKTSKDDPKIQVIILNGIIKEIDVKITGLSTGNATPNRKKILTAVFEYLKDRLRDKVASLSIEK